MPPGWKAEVRPFPGSQSIRDKVEDIVAGVPKGSRYTVVGVANLTGTRLAAIVKLKYGWSFSGYVGYEWFKKPEAGVELRFVA